MNEGSFYMATYTTTPRSLLVVNDNNETQNDICRCLTGYDIHHARDHIRALTLVKTHAPAVAIIDLCLALDTAIIDEISLIENILRLAPMTRIIALVEAQNRIMAARAIAAGAYNFFIKPIHSNLLTMLVNRAYRLYELHAEDHVIPTKKSKPTTAPMPLPGLITNNARMLVLCKKIEKIAHTDVTTLIHGESGSGKEVGCVPPV